MQTLTVIATPVTTEDLIINIIDGPASTCEGVTMCAASADRGIAADPETATFRNTTAAPKTVFVQIAGYQSNDTSYTLNIQIQ